MLRTISSKLSAFCLGVVMLGLAVVPMHAVTVCLKCEISVGGGTVNCVKIKCPE